MQPKLGDRFEVVNDNHHPDLVGPCGKLTTLKQYKHYTANHPMEFVDLCITCRCWL